MLPIQKRRRHRRDEKLASISILPRVRHTQQSRSIMLQREVLVGKCFGAVDAGTPGAVTVEKVAALQHEGGDYAVEFGPFVALRATEGGLRLAGAELSEVFGGLGDGVGEELDQDAAEGFAWRVLVGC